MNQTSRKSRQEAALVPESGIDFEHELSRGFAASYIRRRARELARRWPQAEAEDLAQQLTLQLWQSLSRFDPRQGCFNAFVKLVVNGDLAHLKRKLVQEQRDRRAECSFSDQVPGWDARFESLGDVIGQRELDAKLGRDSRTWDLALEQTQDVTAAIAKLPPRLARIARLLMDQSPTQVARDMRVSRTTLYELIARIRKRFISLDLGGDFGISSDTLRS